MVNTHLMKDLIKLGLWNPTMKARLMAGNGSIQHIEEIPAHIRLLYRTVWEIPQRALIDMAADRGAYICQSQSMNLFVQGANHGKLTSMHFYSWKKGLKTGIYYLRTPAAADAIKFTLDKEALKEPVKVDAPLFESPKEPAGSAVVNGKVYTVEEQLACSLDNPENCEVCGS